MPSAAPAFALSIPRPQVWLLARGVLRDVTLHSDPSLLTGSRVVLHAPSTGDQDGYRRLTHLLQGTAYEGRTAAQVQAECPKLHLVGLARIERVVPVPEGWRVHLVEMHLLAPVPFSGGSGVEVWAIPLHMRRALARDWAAALAMPPAP